MVKVTGPMISLSASGKFANTMTFVCGTSARRAAAAREMQYSQKQTDQQTKFSDALIEWNSLGDQKKLWTAFAERVKKSGACDVNLDYYMTGYQTFMSYYLQEGIGGWQNYPLPPI